MPTNTTAWTKAEKCGFTIANQCHGDSVCRAVNVSNEMLKCDKWKKNRLEQ